MITYTASELVTIVASLGVLVTAAGGIIVNVIVALRTTSKVEEVVVKTDVLAQKVGEVHTMTNSNLAAVKADLALARSEITSLLALVQDLRNERDKAALTVALNTPAPSQTEAGATP